jgi:hypothetical protein
MVVAAWLNAHNAVGAESTQLCREVCRPAVVTAASDAHTVVFFHTPMTAISPFG